MFKEGDIVLVKTKKVDSDKVKIWEAIVDKITKSGQITLLISDFSCSRMKFSKKLKLMSNLDFCKEHYEIAEILEYNEENKKEFDKQFEELNKLFEEHMKLCDEVLGRCN